MGKSIARSVGAIVGLGLLFAACSGTKQTTGGTSTAGSDSGGSNSDSNGGAGAISGKDGGAGRPNVCSPGSKRCDGSKVKACDETGFKETTTQTCLSSQSCVDAVCVETCLPNTAFCKEGAVWKCDKNGVSARDQQCAVGMFCRVEGDSASCSTQACTPSTPFCDGDVATICASDGSGPTSGGVDCTKNKQACYGGQCRDVACSNGKKECQHGDVYLCAHNGTDITLLTDCRTGEVCDGDMGSCRARVCDPGQVSCDGTRIQTCNAFGSAWLPGAMDCAADGKICVSGSCKKQICAPSRSSCQNGSVYSCDPTGTASTLSQTCNPQTEHCATYSGGSFGFCDENACNAGDTLCDGNQIKVCNADGSLPATGMACGAAQYCENAKCKDLDCTPGNFFCKGSAVYYCDFSGQSLSEQCASDKTCKAMSASGAACAPLACTPSSSACVGNQIGTCASDGQSLSQVSNDCTTTTSVCTADLKCAKSAADAVGVNESAEVLWAGSMVGDAIDVDSTRKLTELQTNLVLSSPRELRWIVYELSDNAFVAKIDKVVSNVTGSGFISSGPLSFQLTAGKRYVLGVVISGGDSVDYTDGSPFSGDVSFGTVVGRVIASYPGSFDAYSVDPGYVSQMKMTTEAP